jgi:hypothetical protein
MLAPLSRNPAMPKGQVDGQVVHSFQQVILPLSRANTNLHCYVATSQPYTCILGIVRSACDANLLIARPTTSGSISGLVSSIDSGDGGLR